MLTFLRDTLTYGQFWVLEAQFALLLGMTLREGPRLVRRVGLARHQIAILALCGIGAAMISGFVVPRTNRIFYDEHIYQGAAQSLADLRVAQICEDGSVEYGRLKCSHGTYNKEPYGFPYLLSVVYRVLGAHESTAFIFNNIVLALVVVTVGLTAALLSGEWWAAIGAAAMVGILPEQLVWGNTAASEPISELMTAFALLTVLYFCQVRTTSALVWTAIVTAFAMNMRLESFLVAPLALLAVAIWARDEYSHRRLWYAAAGIGLLNILLAVHLVVVRNESWGAQGSRMSFSNAWTNLSANGWFYFGDERFLLLVTVAALGGAWRHHDRRVPLFQAIYFLAFWSTFLGFYAGSYNYGADVRYSLLTYPPLCILGGLGVKQLKATLSSRTGSSWATGIIASVLAAQIVDRLPLIRSVGEESWAARADVAFARRLTARLPSESYVFTHNPSEFLLRGVDAGLMTTSWDQPFMSRLDERYPGGVYLHWNFWCNVIDAREQQLCRDSLNRFPHEVVEEQVVRNFRYALYRLRLPKAQIAPYVKPDGSASDALPQTAEGVPGIPK